jgi:hypothetical protein
MMATTWIMMLSSLLGLARVMLPRDRPGAKGGGQPLDATETMAAAAAAGSSSANSAPNSGRVHGAMVGHVVAEVALRRDEERAQPDGVSAEPDDLVQPRGHAGQVTDAVAVGVEEAARIDLVDHRAALPVRCRPVHRPDAGG